MSTPIFEKDEQFFPAFEPNQPSQSQSQAHAQRHARRSSDEDSTLQGEAPDDRDQNHLRVTTSYVSGPDHLSHIRSPTSPSAQREHAQRLDDDLLLLRAERVVSSAERSAQEELGRSRSMARSRSRNVSEPADDFDIGTTPIHEKTKIYQPPANPTTRLSRAFKRLHNSSFLVRYFFYISPLAILLLVPTLLGHFIFPDANVGGVELFWFGIWLEIVWLTLWAARIISKMIPWPMGMISSLFTNNSKKWRDLGKALEVPATIFFWWLAIEISFLPTMKNHHSDGNKATKDWEKTMNKVIISIFVGTSLNFIEKIIIQLIAISFHLRTYADRIEINKFQISSLVKLYVYSKDKIAMEDSEFETAPNTGTNSGARTPMIYVQKAQKNARHVFNRVGDVAGRVAGDFTGKAVTTSTHPHQVVLQLLHSTTGSQVLARRLYRTFVPEDSETVFSDDLRLAFDNDDEADAAFTMFDKDLNGDISMEELEAVCVEIGRERKAITASLKDLDSVVSKLDSVFLFIVAIITLLVFVSLISSSAQTALTSLGSTVLALSWLFSVTAQEFLQSLIFVFVKHPFDVGDRVTIYGNTGSQGTGDDYFVKKISLLYTEFKKMEGHVVQAPNSYLNTLFILNQRRSGGLAEAVPVTVKFGTTLAQIDTLRTRLLEFVASENREYQKNILTELTTIFEAYSITLNVVFFYKSNWQNELLRLQRRNKFICAMMVTMQELGIEGPRLGQVPGATHDIPVFLHTPHPSSQAVSAPDAGFPGGGPRSGSLARNTPFVAPPSSSDPNYSNSPSSINTNTNPLPPTSHPSILRHRTRTTSHSQSLSRARGESVSAMGKRVDFSLGMASISSGADFGDVYDDAPKTRLPPPSAPAITTTSPSPGRGSRSAERESDRDGDGLARMGSRDNVLGKVVSGESGWSRRNRFFGRARGGSKLGSAEEGTNLDDLESGPREFSAGDMPDIPEAEGSSWSEMSAGGEREKEGRWERSGGGGGERGPDGVWRADYGVRYGVGRERGGAQGSGGIDPRSGIVSPQAVIGDSARERGELPRVEGRGA